MAITDVAGVRVGHWSDSQARTGCTVVLLPSEGAVAGVDVRGAAPGTRETDLLRPGCTVERVHAVLLTGGSAFGLAAADGLARAAGLAAGLAAGFGLAAAAGLAEGLAAAAGLAAVVGFAGAVVGGGAVVGLGAPPVWQALRNSASADAPAASKRKLRIGYSSFRGSCRAVPR